MKILLVGASGTLGAAVHAALKERHEVVTASRGAADVHVDMTNPDSIAAMFEEVSNVDAVARAAGLVALKPLAALDRKEIEAGIRHKLLGQVDLVRLGAGHVAPTGSFTLVTSVLSHDPVPGSTIAALVSGGLTSFVVAAAIELRQRINAVSPSVFTTSLAGGGASRFPGAQGVTPQRVARAHVKSIEGAQTGQIYRVEESF